MRVKKSIRAVAVFEASKGLLALAAASGFFLLVHKDLHVLIVRLVEHAHLNPAAHYPNIFIDAMTHLQNSNLLLIALGTITYSVFRLVEAYGLFREAAWAEILAVISGAIYVPFEVVEIFHRVSWLSVSALVVNSAVVLIMLYALRQRKRGNAA